MTALLATLAACALVAPVAWVLFHICEQDVAAVEWEKSRASRIRERTAAMRADLARRSGR